jgi:hypothetical protein
MTVEEVIYFAGGMILIIGVWKMLFDWKED